MCSRFAEIVAACKRKRREEAEDISAENTIPLHIPLHRIDEDTRLSDVLIEFVRLRDILYVCIGRFECVTIRDRSMAVVDPSSTPVLQALSTHHILLSHPPSTMRLILSGLEENNCVGKTSCT